MTGPKPDRMVTLHGPFTDEELGEITALMQRIEGRRPDETFSIGVRADDVGDVRELMRQINPLRPGYERKVIWIERNDTDG